MNYRLIRIWEASKQRIFEVLPNETIAARIQKTNLKSWLEESSRISKRRFKYHPEFRIPAFYDPNENIIFLNEPLVNSISDGLVADIFHHELLHAASDHSVIEKNEALIYKSGIKIQVFHNNRETCHFRGINEGYVQSLCNYLSGNGKSNKAYREEIVVVERLKTVMGEQIFEDAFFGNQIEPFYDKAEQTIGAEALERVGTRVDREDFAGAMRALAN